MRLVVASLPLWLALTACDTAYLFGPPRTIDDGPGEGEGEGSPAGEGEGEGGEGEGEGAAAVCGGAFQVVASPPIAMTSSRERHAAALLADGRVLVAGGNDGTTGESQASAEIFDPASGTFTATGSMIEARSIFALVGLDDGRAVAFGGFNNDSATPDDNGSLQTTEIWSPDSGTWSAGPAMPEPRDSLSAVKLDDGRVLVFGGQTNAQALPTDVLVFDPADDSLTATGAAIAEHGTSHTAHLLSDGRVLMVGGFLTESLARVDVLFPDGHEAPAPSIPGARRSACAADDDKGDALVFGGYAGGEIDDVEAYAVSADSWSPRGRLTQPRAGCEAAHLSCLDVVCGGFVTTSCEAWDFASNAAVALPVDVGVNFGFTLTALDDSHALLTGGVVNSFDVSQNAVLLSLEPAP